MDAGGGLVGGWVARGADAALRVVVEWVVGGAGWLLGELMGFIATSTRPDVRQGWFSVAYADMARVALVLLVPLLLLSVIQALMRQSAGQLVRSWLVGVPVACVGMFAAVAVVDQLVVVTDALSAWVGRSLGADLTTFATTLGGGLDTLVLASWGNPVALPGFAVFLAALVVAFASFAIWVLLVVRQAAIYAAVLFLPLGFAALVWPATAHWLRRLTEGLVAVIMAKFVIVAVLAMASGALAAAGQEGMSAVITGGSLLVLAAFAPFVLLRWLPVFEAGAASHFDGVGLRSRTTLGGSGVAANVYRAVRQHQAADAAAAPSAGGGAFPAVPAAAGAAGGAGGSLDEPACAPRRGGTQPAGQAAAQASTSGSQSPPWAGPPAPQTTAPPSSASGVSGAAAAPSMPPRRPLPPMPPQQLPLPPERPAGEEWGR